MGTESGLLELVVVYGAISTGAAFAAALMSHHWIESSRRLENANKMQQLDFHRQYRDYTRFCKWRDEQPPKTPQS